MQAHRVKAITPPISNSPSDNPVARWEQTRKPLSRMQEVVAQRMTEAKATVPHFQVTADLVVDDLIALRGSLLEIDSESAPTLNDLLIKACAIVLRSHPLANGSYQPDGFVLNSHVNVGFAVSADEALYVPTVFDADLAGITSIARETRRLIGLIRAKRISPAELSGGTFSISNLGMFGMSSIIPVVNAPQAAILGVGSARRVPAVDDDGNLSVETLMTVTLSCDHRILYGADAARFVADLRNVVERPLRLML